MAMVHVTIHTAKLEERMERWMELSELAEEIERNKA